MNYTEETAIFACQGNRLVGILTKPAAPLEIGVVIIVGGPQYRVGSHRQFVLLSRALAAQGFSVLRFDYRGMGDSEGDLRDFEGVSLDVGAAIDLLQKNAPNVKEIVLWGLCDGASAALLYCHETADARVTGLCLLNPWVRSAASLARTRVKHYYLRRLLQSEFWLKLLRGGVARTATAELFSNLKALRTNSAAARAEKVTIGNQAENPFQERMALAWAKFSGSILLVLSEDDYTAKEFLEHAHASASWQKNLITTK